MNSDQSRRVEQVGHSEHAQTADSSPDPSAVLQLAQGQNPAVGQVELYVPLRQSLQGNGDR